MQGQLLNLAPTLACNLDFNGYFLSAKQMTDIRPLRLLVICTGNRARSQMAHGWLRHLGGPDVEVNSAGTDPKGVHPLAVRVMAESGIDISSHTSDHVDRYADDQIDLVVTVCDSAREKCPIFPGAKRTLHHSYEDPDKPGIPDSQLLPIFRRIRDEIEAFSRELLHAELLR